MPKTKKMKRRLRMWRRQAKKSRRSMWDDIAVYIALGGALIISLVGVALWVILPTLQQLYGI